MGKIDLYNFYRDNFRKNDVDELFNIFIAIDVTNIETIIKKCPEYEIVILEEEKRKRKLKNSNTNKEYALEKEHNEDCNLIEQHTPHSGSISFEHLSYYIPDTRNDSYRLYDPYSYYYLPKLCAKEIYRYKDTILKIIHDNPNSTKSALEIINFIAPVITSKYSGIPICLVVGSITLLIKRGIEIFLDKR